MRTPTGWHPSPVGKRGRQDKIAEAPDQHDSDTDADDNTFEEAVFDDAAPFVPQDTPDDCVPLSDQAAVEHEAEQWALLLKEKAEYDLSRFDINEDMLHQMLPEAIRTAAATFPAGTGLGHDHISPRAFL